MTDFVNTSASEEKPEPVAPSYDAPIVHAPSHDAPSYDAPISDAPSYDAPIVDGEDAADLTVSSDSTGPGWTTQAGAGSGPGWGSAPNYESDSTPSGASYGETTIPHSPVEESVDEGGRYADPVDVDEWTASSE